MLNDKNLESVINNGPIHISSSPASSLSTPPVLERTYSYTKEMKPKQENMLRGKILKFLKRVTQNVLGFSMTNNINLFITMLVVLVVLLVSILSIALLVMKITGDREMLIQGLYERNFDDDDDDVNLQTASSVTIFSPSVMNGVLYRPLITNQNSFHIHMDIGTPVPRRKLLIVDTGSYLMAFPCHVCKNCGKRHSDQAYFNYEESETGQIVPCDECKSASYCITNSMGNKVCWLSMQYTEGSSWTGFEVSDYVGFGDAVDADYNIQYQNSDNVHTSARHIFGCINSEKGTFQYQSADGIMGMAVKSPGSSIVDSFHRAGTIDNRSFSLCFSKKGGIFSLGGSASATHTNDAMKFTPLDPSHTFYVVQVESVFIDDEKVSNGLRGFSQGRGSIVDSGT